MYAKNSANLKCRLTISWGTICQYQCVCKISSQYSTQIKRSRHYHFFRIWSSVKFNQFRSMDKILFTLFCTRKSIFFLGDYVMTKKKKKQTKKKHENSLLLLFVNKRCFLSRLHRVCVSLLFICIKDKVHEAP